jgi:uncharacterized protein
LIDRRCRRHSRRESTRKLDDQNTMPERPRLRAIGKKNACPVCGKPIEPRYKPFCSQRCAQIDLGRWFGEVYRVPAGEPEADEADRPQKKEDDADA